MNDVLIRIDFNKGLELSREEIRQYIADLEEVMKTMPQIEIPVDHYFANKGSDKAVYGRAIRMDAGSLIVGKIHKYETINVINRGDVSVLSQDGVMRLKAGEIFVSTPGAKRVIYAHEGSEWTTFHHSLNTEPEAIVEEFTVKDYQELESKEIKAIEGV